MRPVLAIVATILVVLLGVTTIFGSWYTIDQGERGVLLRNGAVIGVAQPGLGFKLPWFDDVEYISVQNRVRLYEKVAAYSFDQQAAEMVVSVNYRMPIDQVADIYANFGGEDGLVSRLVDRKFNEQVKNVFGRFNALAAIQERGRLNQEIEEAVRSAVVGPVIIDAVQVENIDFSDAYEQSVEARMLAEVEVQKLRQNAEREKVQAAIAVTQANGRADAVRAEATARAEAITLVGEAEATAIKARGDALRENVNIIMLTQAEKWDGKLPVTMIPGSTVPFLNVGQ